MREIRITPSILNADHSHINDEIARIAKVSDFIHLDIMDGQFVPATTWNFEEAQSIIKSSTAPVDAHLMVASVDEIAPRYAQAGAASVTFHVEAVADISRTALAIKSHGARAAIALKPDTAPDDYLKYCSEIDMFLVMTVEPGAGGQPFMDRMLPKIAQIKKAIGDRPIWLQVDGGISLATIERAAEAGADTFVAGSAVFKAEDPAAMVSLLRSTVIENGLA
jgi:ribulose-phosphate 3-epimerase